LDDDVRLIADRTTPCERNTGLELIAGAGASVWIDHGVRIAHAKTMVIDGKVTLVGSMNWSRGAALNSENLNLIVSPEVAETYGSALAAAPGRLGAICRAPGVVPAPHCRRRSVSELELLFGAWLTGSIISFGTCGCVSSMRCTGLCRRRRPTGSAMVERALTNFSAALRYPERRGAVESLSSTRGPTP
jgi:PLD-like domain